MPGFKVSKDRLTLLLGGNAAGDFKLKPMIVYHSENPRALKGCHKQSLPVLWEANKKAWVTTAVFEKWFTTYFCPAVREYCIKKNLDHKALLILDNAPGHPRTLSDLCSEVKVVYLPPNTTSILQPMDQGVISTFKAYYLRETFNQALRASEGETGVSLKEFWRCYNIRQAIENISKSWDEVSEKTMNAVWKNLWDDCANFLGFDITEDVINETVDLARMIGLDEVEAEDIQDLIEANKEELTDIDLLEMQQHWKMEERSKDVCDDEEIRNKTKVLTTSNINEILNLVDCARNLIKESDPDFERSSLVARSLNDSVNCYKELLLERNKTKKQLSLDSYFSKSQRKSSTTTKDSSSNDRIDDVDVDQLQEPEELT